MSLRKPTSKSKTGQFSSRAEKIKALKERARKLNPLSPARKKLMQQIKKLEAASKPVSKKFTYTGKKIGDKPTKTGQFKEKPPEVKKPIFKLKGDASKRRKEERLAEEEELKKQVRQAKARKISEKLEDTPPKKTQPVSKVKKDKEIKTYPDSSPTSTQDAKTHATRLQSRGIRSTVLGDERGSTVIEHSGSLSQAEIDKAKKALAKKKTSSGDKPGRKIGSQAGYRKPAVKGRVDKTAVAPSKVQAKPISVAAKKKPKTRLQILKERGKATSPKTDYINPRDPKRLEKLRKRKLGRTAVSDMLKVRQAKPTPQRPDRTTKPRIQELPLTWEEKQLLKKPVKTPVSKQKAPIKLATVKPGRKPIQSQKKGVPAGIARFTPQKGKRVRTPELSAKMTAQLAEKYKGDPDLDPRVKKPAIKRYKGDPHLDPSKKSKAESAISKPPKAKEAKGFFEGLGFKQTGGPKDWSGGKRTYKTPFGEITMDTSGYDPETGKSGLFYTEEEKERMDLGLDKPYQAKKGGPIKKVMKNKKKKVAKGKKKKRVITSKVKGNDLVAMVYD